MSRYANAKLRRLLREYPVWGYDRKGWSLGTRRLYARRVAAAAEFLAGVGVSNFFDASTNELQAWLSSVSRNAETRNLYRQALVAFFDFAIEQHATRHNPAADLARLKVPEALPKALTAQQAFAVEKASASFDERIGLLVIAYLYQAFRRNEARTLKWSQIYEGWVSFTSKGSKDRVLPLHERFAEHLFDWRSRCPSAQWVFPTNQQARGDQPFSESWVRTSIRAVGEQAGVPDLHPHQLRHTCATRLVEQGLDVRLVQEWLGHKQLTTTARYMRVRPVRLMAVTETLSYE